MAIKNKIIKDDLNLLNSLESDAYKVSEIYKPGPYWSQKTKQALSDIKKFGVNQFREGINRIGTSFTDTAITDTRTQFSNGLKGFISKILYKIYPFNRLFDNQVAYTVSFFNNYVDAVNNFIEINEECQRILKIYNIPEDNTIGGCKSYFRNDKYDISHNYIQSLSSLDNVKNFTNIEKAHSFMEIGGGFGAFTHCIIENIKNIRKLVYVDIFPNIYLGTCYLKTIYGNSVKDYDQLKNRKSIQFENNKSLEILCIPPWLISNLNCKIDHFHNAHSFVEMPKEVVKNYAKTIEKLSSNESEISLFSYSNFDLQTTFNPNDLPKLLGFKNFVWNEKKVSRIFSKQSPFYFYAGSRKS